MIRTIERIRLRRLIPREIDIVTKVMFVILITVTSYFAFLLILGSLLQDQPRSMYEMMRQMMYDDRSLTLVNLGSLSSAVAVGLIFSMLLKTKSANEDELKVIRRALSEDEKTVLDEVKRAGRITQDSLRFRLGWSKAKVSRILANLDNMNLIQRERTGKTYIVFLSGKETETV